jgi:hypothetical protein
MVGWDSSQNILDQPHVPRCIVICEVSEIHSPRSPDDSTAILVVYSVIATETPKCQTAKKGVSYTSHPNWGPLSVRPMHARTSKGPTEKGHLAPSV